MSSQAIKACRAVHGLAAAAKLVLFVLADEAEDKSMEASCPVSTIIKDSGLSERAVRYALRQLEAAGWIRLKSRQMGGASTYTVFPAGITKVRQRVPHTIVPIAPNAGIIV